MHLPIPFHMSTAHIRSMISPEILPAAVNEICMLLCTGLPLPGRGLYLMDTSTSEARPVFFQVFANPLLALSFWIYIGSINGVPAKSWQVSNNSNPVSLLPSSIIVLTLLLRTCHNQYYSEGTLEAIVSRLTHAAEEQWTDTKRLSKCEEMMSTKQAFKIGC